MELCVLISPQASYFWSNQLLNRAHNGYLDAVPLFNLKKAFRLYKKAHALGKGNDGIVNGNGMFKKK